MPVETNGGRQSDRQKGRWAKRRTLRLPQMDAGAPEQGMLQALEMSVCGVALS